MFARASWRVVLMALVLALVAPDPAHAQFGGLKKKLQEKAQQVLLPGGSDADESELRDPVPSSEVETRGAVEMTGELLDRFIKGIEAERWVIAHAAEAEKRYKEREKCKENVAQEPGFMEMLINMQSRAAGDHQRMMTMADSLEAIFTSKCGEEISANPEQAAEAASGLVSGEYAQMKERLIAFILARRLHPKVTDKVASGNFIFSAVEIRAVNERYARLESLMEPELREITEGTGS